MRYFAYLFVLLFFGFMNPAHASSYEPDTSFSIYYGSYAPLPKCDDSQPEQLDLKKAPRDSYEVQYLYGRNVLGYGDEWMEYEELNENYNLPYGWSLRSSSLADAY